MEHPNEFPYSPPKWKNQTKEDGAKKCAYIRSYNNDYMDISNARMWIVHQPTTIKNESCKANTNKGQAILGWNTR